MRREAAGAEQAVAAKELDRLRALPERARRRAAGGAHAKGRELISKFRLDPPVIRVTEHKAGRFSFVLKDAPKSVSTPRSSSMTGRGPASGSSPWRRRPATTS